MKDFLSKIKASQGIQLPSIVSATSLATDSSGNMIAGSVTAAPQNDALQSGVMKATDVSITRDSASQVTVSAGTVWVADSTGLLVRTTPSSTALSSIPAASASKFRLDQVVVSSAGVISRLAGVEGTTVNLNNRTSAASVPSGSIRLYDILVSSTGVDVFSATTIRDRRPWARGAYSRIDYSGANQTITVGTELTALDQRVEFVAGNQIRMSFWCAYAALGASGCDFPFRSQGPGTTSKSSMNNDLGRHPEGAHRIDISWQSTFGTGGSYLLGVRAEPAAVENNTFNHTFGTFLAVEEIVRPNANNGIA